MRRTGVASTLLALALTTFACGETDEQGAESTTTTAAAETTTTTAAPTTTTAGKDLSEDSPLRLDGIGPIKIGMTPAEATQALGRDVAVDENEVLNDTCGYAKASGGPDNLAFMVLRNDAKAEWRIHRVDVYDGSRIATGEGIRIGSTEDDVKKAYGAQVKVEEHPYQGPEGHYLIVNADGEGTGFKFIFETDGATVTRFRSGNDEAASFIEGCA
ncbi:MAG: hypothetical protein ACRD0C_01815 [Acidimicrobiia bacterium]